MSKRVESNGYVAMADFLALDRRVKVLERQIAEYRAKDATNLVVEDRDRRTEAGLT